MFNSKSNYLSNNVTVFLRVRKTFTKHKLIELIE